MVAVTIEAPRTRPVAEVIPLRLPERTEPTNGHRQEAVPSTVIYDALNFRQVARELHDANLGQELTNAWHLGAEGEIHDPEIIFHRTPDQLEGTWE